MVSSSITKRLACVSGVRGSSRQTKYLFAFCSAKQGTGVQGVTATFSIQPTPMAPPNMRTPNCYGLLLRPNLAALVFRTVSAWRYFKIYCLEWNFDMNKWFSRLRGTQLREGPTKCSRKSLEPFGAIHLRTSSE